MNKKTSILLMIFIALITSVIGSLVISILIIDFSNLVKNKLFNLNFNSIISIFWNSNNYKLNFLIIFINLFIITFLFFIKFANNFSLKNKNSQVKIADEKIYGNSNWLINEHENETNFNEFEKIYQKNFKTPSFLCRSNIENGKIVFHGIECKKIVNTITIGATGSGKSTKDIEPTIIANCMLDDEVTIIKETQKKYKKNFFNKKQHTDIKNEIIKYNKPNFVVTDTKGELYESLKNILRANNYDVQKIDFKRPEKSMSWNILENILYYFEKYIFYKERNILKKSFIDLNLLNEFIKNNKCFVHDAFSCPTCFELTHNEKNESFEIFINKDENIWYLNQNDVDYYVENISNIFKQRAIDEVDIIAGTLIDINQEQQNKSWFIGCQNLFKGVIFALMESYQNNKKIFNNKWFNIFNVVDILSNKKKTCKWILDLAKNNDNTLSWRTCGNIITTEPKVLDQYFSILSTQISVFLQEGLKNILCKNEINLFDFDNLNKPKAFFIIIPDDDDSKSSVISVLISQIYKNLFYLADQNKNKCLNRSTMMLIDEFANISPIKNFDSFLNTARSRKIYTSIILQDFSQLNKNYKQTASSIKSACLLIKYLKSMNLETQNEISKQCGTMTINVSNYSEKKDFIKSYSLKSKLLIEQNQVNEVANQNMILINLHSNPSVVKLLNVWEFKKLIDKEHFQWNESINYFNYENEYRVDLSLLTEYIEKRKIESQFSDALKEMSIYKNENLIKKKNQIRHEKLKSLRLTESEYRKVLLIYKDIPMNQWTSKNKIEYEKINHQLSMVLNEKRKIYLEGENENAFTDRN